MPTSPHSPILGLGPRVLALLLVLIFAVLAPTELVSAEKPPFQPGSAVVERLQSALIEVMRNSGELGYAGRRDQIAPVIEASFDLPLMARKSAGRHWKKLTDDERERLLSAFRRLSVATYAARFNSYSGERFEMLAEEPAVHETRLVRTELVSETRRVKLDYRLYDNEGRWRIFDIVVDGSISELALRRSQYSSLIKRRGFDGLLDVLEEKISENEATTP